MPLPMNSYRKAAQFMNSVPSEEEYRAANLADIKTLAVCVPLATALGLLIFSPEARDFVGNVMQEGGNLLHRLTSDVAPNVAAAVGTHAPQMVEMIGHLAVALRV